MTKRKIFDTFTIILALVILILAIFLLKKSYEGREIVHYDEEDTKDAFSYDYLGGTSTNKGEKIYLKVKVTNGTADLYLHIGEPKSYSSDIKENEIIIKKMNITSTKIKYTVKNEKIISFHIDTHGKKEVNVDYVVKNKYHVVYLFYTITFFVVTFILFYGIIINIEVKREAILEITDRRVYDLLLKYFSKNDYEIESENQKFGKISAIRITFFKTTGEKYDFNIERLSKCSTKLLISVKTIHNVSHNSKFFVNSKIEDMLDFIRDSGKFRKFKKF